MPYLFILVFVVVITIIVIVMVTTCFLPQKEDVQLEVNLLSDSDCSLEKAVIDLKIANDLEDIENTVLVFSNI